MKDKCVCNAEKICCKMQKRSLRVAISKLKQDKTRGEVKDILKVICNVLTVYDCCPGSSLLERVNWVYQQITAGKGASFYSGERDMIEMLIVELEVFLNS